LNKFVIEFTRRASAQLRSIFSYIANDSANAALSMVDMLERRAHKLEKHPLIGTELPQNEYPFLQPGYRKLVANPFILYYRVINNTVYIAHIIQARRSQAKALAEEE